MKSTPRKLSFAKKAVRVEARLNADQKKRIEHAANLKGTSLSDFIIGSADEAAIRTIQEHETWVLRGEDSEAFVNALLNPPEPSERMKAAVAWYKKRRRRSA